jgi:hypothetical protein
MKEEFLKQDFWAPDVDSGAVGAALQSISTELCQHRDDSLYAIVPTLKAYGVSLN